MWRTYNFLPQSKLGGCGRSLLSFPVLVPVDITRGLTGRGRRSQSPSINESSKSTIKQQIGPRNEDENLKYFRRNSIANAKPIKKDYNRSNDKAPQYISRIIVNKRKFPGVMKTESWPKGNQICKPIGTNASWRDGSKKFLDRIMSILSDPTIASSAKTRFDQFYQQQKTSVVRCDPWEAMKIMSKKGDSNALNSARNRIPNRAQDKSSTHPNNMQKCFDYKTRNNPKGTTLRTPSLVELVKSSDACEWPSPASHTISEYQDIDCDEYKSSRPSLVELVKSSDFFKDPTRSVQSRSNQDSKQPKRGLFDKEYNSKARNLKFQDIEGGKNNSNCLSNSSPAESQNKLEIKKQNLDKTKNISKSKRKTVQFDRKSLKNSPVDSNENDNNFCNNSLFCKVKKSSSEMWSKQMSKLKGVKSDPEAITLKYVGARQGEGRSQGYGKPEVNLSRIPDAEKLMKGCNKKSQAGDMRWQRAKRIKDMIEHQQDLRKKLNNEMQGLKNNSVDQVEALDGTMERIEKIILQLSQVENSFKHYQLLRKGFEKMMKKPETDTKTVQDSKNEVDKQIEKEKKDQPRPKYTQHISTLKDGTTAVNRRFQKGRKSTDLKDNRRSNLKENAINRDEHCAEAFRFKMQAKRFQKQEDNEKTGKDTKDKEKVDETKLSNKENIAVDKICSSAKQRINRIEQMLNKIFEKLNMIEPEKDNDVDDTVTTPWHIQTDGIFANIPNNGKWCNATEGLSDTLPTFYANYLDDKYCLFKLPNSPLKGHSANRSDANGPYPQQSEDLKHIFEKSMIVYWLRRFAVLPLQLRPGSSILLPLPNSNGGYLIGGTSSNLPIKLPQFSGSGDNQEWDFDDSDS